VKTGAYLVQPYTEGPVAATAFGEPTVVCKENFNSQIADAILASLKKFGEDKYDRIRAIRHSPGERAQFLKRHVAVGVEELVSGGLIIRPLLHEGGGFVGLDEDFPKRPTAQACRCHRRGIQQSYLKDRLVKSWARDIE